MNLILGCRGHLLISARLVRSYPEPVFGMSFYSMTIACRLSFEDYLNILCPQVPWRGTCQLAKHHVAHRHHFPQRRLRRHRPQHILRPGHRRHHRHDGELELIKRTAPQDFLAYIYFFPIERPQLLWFMINSNYECSFKILRFILLSAFLKQR